MTTPAVQASGSRQRERGPAVAVEMPVDGLVTVFVGGLMSGARGQLNGRHGRSYFQPARSMIRTASVLSSPSTSRLTWSALKVPQSVSVGLHATPLFTGYS